MMSTKNTELAMSTIGENSFFSGNIHLSGQLKIDGKYEGNNLIIEQLTVGKTGKIKCNVEADIIIVEGIIIGNIEAKTRVMLMPTAAIYGDIKTPELIIQNGVILEGKCIISPNLSKNIKEVIEKRYNE
ncbi:MAG: polymer-forming cytoskeletal protein [Spirochaetes bacterium]|nr:polymer-forming cytoskeletal protein [Spirochaetota bacterium]MBP8991079.1 polymer-forming cytoskeletal protein [Spirochaetota bacterium]